MDGWLTIGDVAAATGESRDTIRYYERIGLVPRAARTDAGYRRYRDGIIRRLGLIRNAQRFGFSLKEIAGFLGVRDGGGKPCHDVRAAAGRLIVAIDAEDAEDVGPDAGGDAAGAARLSAGTDDHAGDADAQAVFQP